MDDILDYFPSLSFHTHQQVLAMADAGHNFSENDKVSLMLLFNKDGGQCLVPFYEPADVFAYIKKNHPEGLLTHLLLRVTPIPNMPPTALYMLCYDPLGTIIDASFKRVSKKALPTTFEGWFSEEEFENLSKDFTLLQSLETIKNLYDEVMEHIVGEKKE